MTLFRSEYQQSFFDYDAMHSDTCERSLFTNGSFTTTVSKQQRVCFRHQRVRVYRNLNKHDMFSILSMEGETKGKVCGYAKAIILDNVKFIVSQKSRQKVLIESKKNVHSFCEGYIRDASMLIQKFDEDCVEISYNPYLMGCFFTTADKKEFNKQGCRLLIQNTGAIVIE